MKREAVSHPFEPVYDGRSRVLILGTMPSPASRAAGFYYGHPRNRFWRLLERAYGEIIADSAADKERFLRRRGLALWDVLAGCEIEGAADSAIRKPAPNDIAGLIRRTAVGVILCNGLTAARLFRRFCAPAIAARCVALPSTSPANRRINPEELFEAWRQAFISAGVLTQNKSPPDGSQPPPHHSQEPLNDR